MALFGRKAESQPDLDRIFINFACAQEDETYTARMRLIGGKYVAEHVEELDLASHPEAAGQPLTTQQISADKIEFRPCVFCQAANFAACPKCRIWTCLSRSTPRKFQCRPSCGHKCTLTGSVGPGQKFEVAGFSAGNVPALPRPQSGSMLGRGIAGLLPGRRR